MRGRWWLVVVGAISVIALVMLVFRAGDDPAIEVGVPAGERRPDVAGVIADVDDTGVTLDDGARYRFGPDSVAFSSYTGQPVGPRVNLFVHLRTEEDLVVWLAVLGVVADVDPPRVTYTGAIERFREDEVVLADGTVLPVAEGVTALPGFAILTIDPASRRVVAIDQDVIDLTAAAGTGHGERA